MENKYLIFSRAVWETAPLKQSGYDFTNEEFEAAERLDIKLIGTRNGVDCYLTPLFKEPEPERKQEDPERFKYWFGERNILLKKIEDLEKQLSNTHAKGYPTDLTNKVKKYLEETAQYDFESDWFDDEIKCLVDDVIQATKDVIQKA